MTWKHVLPCAALAASLTAIGARAQSTLNPDISLIGDVRASWSNSDDGIESDQLNLHLNEVELSFQGYLNPYARADAFVGFHEEEGAEIEEVYLTATRGLPLGLSFSAGQYLLAFGKLNHLHSHAYSFILQPLAHAEYFGEEGLRDVGVRASVPIPTGDIATTLSADVLKGDFLNPHGDEDDPHDAEALAARASQDDDERPNERGFAGRWESFISAGEFSSFSVGASAVTGIPEAETRRWIWGGDVKFRWKPDRYRSLTIVGEYLGNRQPLESTADGDSLAAGLSHTGEPHEYLARHGAFGYVDYQFRQRYNLGAVADWVQSAEDESNESWRVGGFIGFAPVEETSLLRLLVAHEKNVAAGEGYWTGILQLVFSLGPHRPHTF